MTPTAVDISLTDLQKKVSLNSPQIKKVVELILCHEKCSKTSLSFVFVTSQKIKALNKKFLNRNYVTDVLAFDLSDDPAEKKGQKLVGDIIISTDAAIQNAKAFDSSLAGELVLYIIHGILHLMGYDDHKLADIQKMRKKEKELLAVVEQHINRVIK